MHGRGRKGRTIGSLLNTFPNDRIRGPILMRAISAIISHCTRPKAGIEAALSRR